MKYHFSIIDNHIIADINGHPCLIDTGSPQSIGEQSIEIAGSSFSVASSAWVSLESMTDFVGTPLDYLIGTDILRNFIVEIDWDKKELSLLSPNETPSVVDTVIPMHSVQGLPVFKIQLDQSEVNAFFDTGAKISYLKRQLIGDRNSLETLHDFHPWFGDFETPIYEIPLTIADHSFNLRCGFLPEQIEMTLLVLDIQAVIGNDLFSHFPKIQINYQKGMMGLRS